MQLCKESWGEGGPRKRKEMGVGQEEQKSGEVNQIGIQVCTGGAG